MIKNRIIIGLLLVVGVLAIWWFFYPMSPTLATPAVQAKQKEPLSENRDGLPQPIFKEKPSEEVVRQKMEEMRRAKIEQIEKLGAAYNTPINFWGKVVDEKGDPVSGALVKLGTADQLLQAGTRYERITDVHGLFSVLDAKGLSISVNVSKGGYYQTSRSRGQLSYSQPYGNKEPLPAPDKPTIFELRKMGETMPLIHFAERPIRLPKNGFPIEVNLKTGLTTGQGNLKVQCWTNDQVKNAHGHYEWKCVLTVSEGGLIERIDRFAFEAPVDGYQKSVKLTPSSEKWASNVEKQYFIKLSDDRYARINFRMRTGGEHFFVIESYFNPTPGSRNLEYDPSKKLP